MAEWVINQAKSRDLRRPARLVFDYSGYGNKVSTLEKWRGQGGLLQAILITVEALGNEEQHLVVSACSHSGEALPENDPEKLLRFPASLESINTRGEIVEPHALSADIAARKHNLLREINQRNMGYFEQEVQKLDAWADDLKLGLEQDIKAIDVHIKELRRTAASAPTLEEKLMYQKQQRELESKRTKLRRELFARQDDIETERDVLMKKGWGQVLHLTSKILCRHRRIGNRIITFTT